jgi:hypothetical protein
MPGRGARSLTVDSTAQPVIFTASALLLVEIGPRQSERAYTRAVLSPSRTHSPF